MIPKGTSQCSAEHHAGAAKAAQELGGHHLAGSLREDDRASQVSEVEGFVTRGVRHRAGATGRSGAGHAGGGCGAEQDSGRDHRLRIEGQ